MQTGTILKKFRKNRKFNQEQLCKNIITRQTYSKIENNQQEPNYEILLALLERLDYEIDDFNKELETKNEIEKYYKILLQAKNREASLKQIEELYAYSNHNKYKNNTFFQLYGRTVGHLQKFYPNIIEEYSQQDKQFFKKFTDYYSEEYSLSDLKMIADFATHLLPYSDLIAIYNKFPNLNPYKYGKMSEIYTLQMHKIYNNFCDSALFNNDLETAKKILITHRDFSTYYPNMRYLFYIKINELTLGYIETRNNIYLNKLENFATLCQELGDIPTAESITYQTNTLRKNKKYDTTKVISNE